MGAGSLLPERHRRTRQLRQRVAFALSKIFVVSAVEVNSRGGSSPGGEAYGRFPSYILNGLNGPDDSSDGGTWIPTTSRDQYGATLASWFGVPAGISGRSFRASRTLPNPSSDSLLERPGCLRNRGFLRLSSYRPLPESAYEATSVGRSTGCSMLSFSTARRFATRARKPHEIY